MRSVQPTSAAKARDASFGGRAAGGRGVRAAEHEPPDASRVPERELLGDHAAHRHAEHVGGHGSEGVEQRGGVVGELGSRIGPGRRVRLATAAIVEGDHPVRAGERLGQCEPVGGDRRDTCNQQQRRPVAGLLVVQENAVEGGERHPGQAAAGELTLAAP